MAAWIVVCVAMTMAGLAAGMWLERWLRAKSDAVLAHMRENNPRPAPVLEDGLMRDLIVRLMDVSLPKERGEVRGEEEPPGHEAEYEPPMEDVEDWTDVIPELHPQRADWMGVPAGAGVPGMTEGLEGMEARGAEMFDDWEMERQAATSWVEPVDLGGGERVE